MRERTWSIDIGGKPFIADQIGRRQFRVQFDIDISPGSVLSFADIRLYNIDKDSSISQGQSVVLRAGYTDNVDAVFVGFITNVFRERAPGAPEITTRIICKSGSPASDRGSAQACFGPGVTVVEVIRYLARAWPIALDIDETQFAADPAMASGYVIDGDITKAMKELSYAYKFEWIQHLNRMVVSKIDKERRINALQVDQFTGMIGIPEVSLGPDGLGLKVSVQLNPAISLKGVVNIESEFATFNTGNLFVVSVGQGINANGRYNVFSLRHSGDSHTDLWATEIYGLRDGTAPKPPVSTPDNGNLIWGVRVDQAFRARVREIGQTLSLDPNWLMAVMAFETRRTFSPSIVNQAGSGATGLIQFMPSTAQGLGTTTAKLARMTAVQQLDYVEAYFRQYAGRIRDLGDAYMSVLWPAAIGRPDDYVLWEKDTGPYQRQYNQNYGLDANHDGIITKAEAVAPVNRAYQEGQKYVA
ncbi:transglycosylase SLT domain-containing protein [Pseudomonas sp. SWI44]|uniref:baseplate hub protein n=1 Tax=Pseudomonas sp. SWI44 TaxID=2083053 RepID=UPI000CE5D80F|nr:transglycosylase SLT domain-containing protein [Pseudomonas sp. SWI44]AVD86185.1 hypothetical protein C4Q26_03095 [Pseudomonas sp. SWI44]